MFNYLFLIKTLRLSRFAPVQSIGDPIHEIFAEHAEQRTYDKASQDSPAITVCAGGRLGCWG